MHTYIKYMYLHLYVPMYIYVYIYIPYYYVRIHLYLLTKPLPNAGREGVLITLYMCPDTTMD
jgi:hypothetical protein